MMELTNELLIITDKIINQFERTKTKVEKETFIRKLCHFQIRSQHIVDEWIAFVLPWIHEKGFTKLNSNQVHSTKDQLEKTMVQAFFPQTSRKHFTDSIHAIQFVLKAILMEAEK